MLKDGRRRCWLGRPQDINLFELLHSILLPVRIPVIQVYSPAKVFFARVDKFFVLLLVCILLNTISAVGRTAQHLRQLVFRRL